MEEHQITFIVENIDASTYIALPLIRLAKKFKSTISIINITQNRSTELSKAISVYQAVFQRGDVCQITANGVDAELTCFVMKNLIAEYYVLVGSEISYRFSDSLSLRLPQLKTRSDIRWHYAKSQTELTKYECLRGLARLINPSHSEQLLSAFLSREKSSPTCLTSGVALPHVMFEKTKQISIAVITNDKSMDWESKLGRVNIAIGLVIPQKPTMSQLNSITNLTRNLLSDETNERLVKTKKPVDLQAILMHATSTLFK
ncbi:PTS sugar transporter subunit IIA [Vibrio hannami]|uniref:PTS sugar transporter subunit IIA n=1 Tax=Vibrio hannami TaxID=2717094 RepID=UPI00240F3F83|nr:PTS sugar transporter subunit IIA [Vibrio hannami]MDG3085333.1 PTS sugar transporter subunit IIA [Vibrio hannami]